MSRLITRDPQIIELSYGIKGLPPLIDIATMNINNNILRLAGFVIPMHLNRYNINAEDSFQLDGVNVNDFHISVKSEYIDINAYPYRKTIGDIIDTEKTIPPIGFKQLFNLIPSYGRVRTLPSFNLNQIGTENNFNLFKSDIDNDINLNNLSRRPMIYSDKITGTGIGESISGLVIFLSELEYVALTTNINSYEKTVYFTLKYTFGPSYNNITRPPLRIINDGTDKYNADFKDYLGKVVDEQKFKFFSIQELENGSGFVQNINQDLSWSVVVNGVR